MVADWLDGWSCIFRYMLDSYKFLSRIGSLERDVAVKHPHMEVAILL